MSVQERCDLPSSRFYKCESKLEQFYAALIAGSLEREDTANMEEENVRNSHEIRQAENCRLQYHGGTVEQLNHCLV